MEFETYSQRILCPCHGTLQVVRVAGAMAESVDGYHWKLYVADERIVSHTGLSEVRYGDWNPQSGCSRSKIRATSCGQLIEEKAERLLEALTRCAHQVPFEPKDRLEYWLLDEQRGEPLALLETSLLVERPTPIDEPHWHPGGAAQDQFNSDCGNAARLMTQIRQRAGKRPTGIWVERSSRGSGRDVDGEELDGALFPELFLSTHWPDQAQTRLVKDFLAWQAPWLLQIHDLKSATRNWLEQAAWLRPEETSRVFRLFPTVSDTRGLTTTRVKARLMCQEKTDEAPTEPLYPFYNE
jgi:hypothetical protein